MNKLLALIALFFMAACTTPPVKNKIPVYAWISHRGNLIDDSLKAMFNDLKSKGIDGLMYNAGRDVEVYRRVGKLVKEAGMEFHPWIPTLLHRDNPDLKPEWYAVNGKGESSFDKPAYVDYYKFACPNHPEVVDYLVNLYGTVADIPEVDGVHLDYIRFPDVILAEGLWEKYGLVMDREYPDYDYCYCDKCVSDFKAKSGIDIKSIEDPSTVEAWKQFRYDLITSLVNKLAEEIHAKNKQINAAVFPGPNSIAKKIVRQEWDKWNIDAFFPMNYNDFYLQGTAWIGDVCNEGVTALNNSKPLYSGLFICPDPEKKTSEPDPENHGLVPAEIESAIRESMENGAAGICLFTPARMTEEGWKVFEQVIYKQYTVK